MLMDIVLCVCLLQRHAKTLLILAYKFANIKQGGVRGSIALPTLMCVYM
jgi:hypothetical protein